ncbi:hypothetical protein [Paraburkholderia sp. BL21I4N1]|uniref:hypothetical protein n=1 Tax=Paraburkholderia sp. BL21I4N1 TaxID=1938801 RepID=UPI000D4311BC|nr:hypothetical protein [Paraburkholderia sp. BL21I4N1]PQV51799.1 hypothetical protein B0G83_1046 [Paraburkholderia sp. BL21I4N1]
MRNKYSVFLTIISCSACTAFSPYNQTGEEVNRNATQYSNNALLLNVARSELSEPLTFITITGLDGTESATGTLGIPSIIFGPHAATSPKNYVVGPNSTSRTNSNTFHVSVVDDPQSFEALLTPLNPGLVALFIDQDYSRELMFFLTVSRVREVKLVKDSTVVESVVDEWRNDPDDPKAFAKFVGFMASLLVGGLTAQTDITSIAAGKTFPPSKLCFDAHIAKPAFAADILGGAKRGMVALSGVKLPRETAAPEAASAAEATTEKALASLDNCNVNEGWVQTKISTNTGSMQGGAGQGQGSNQGTGLAVSNPQSTALIVAPDGALWIFNANANRITRVPLDKTGSLGKPSSQPLEANAAKPKPEQPTIAYLLTLKSAPADRHFQVFMRSTYGVYDFIGGLIRNGDIKNLVKPDHSGYGGIINVHKFSQSGDSPADCFASVLYRSQTYCVPGDATHTKKLFALLHSLQQLMTAPSNSPTTLQVTNVP